MSRRTELASYFEEHYCRIPRIFCAPGRVNLIGEHTDYNQGFVMPAAIEFETLAAIAPREDRKIEVYSRNYRETVTFDLDEPDPAPRHHWSDYVHGVIVMIQRAGYSLRGADCVIDGGVPIGSGLSSSAALEVASALAFLTNSGLTMDRTELALLCQRAENLFVGAQSGIMDQFIACYGQRGHAMLLDCRSLERRYVPVPPTVKLVVCDTMVRHSLASNEYNLRRAQCESGVRTLSQFIPGIEALRDVTIAQLETYRSALDPIVYRRCRHVITENARALEAAEALERNDPERMGQLMIASHKSLRDDYEVSCPALDLMVDLALKMEGVHGARMTGGGFGGCTINVVDSDNAHDFAHNISLRYAAESGKQGAAYICYPQDGAAEEGT